MDDTERVVDNRTICGYSHNLLHVYQSLSPHSLFHYCSNHHCSVDILLELERDLVVTYRGGFEKSRF